MMIKYVKVMSDLHLEWAPMTVPADERDAETLLVLAGDITSVNAAHMFNDADSPTFEKLSDKGVEKVLKNTLVFMNNIKGRFAGIVAVAGNHEFYHSDLSWRSYMALKEFYVAFGVKYLENSTASFLSADSQQILVFGATAWTDYDDANPRVEKSCLRRMNDFPYISDSDSRRPTVPKDFYERNVLFRDQLRHFFKMTSEMGDDVIKIVVTHHLPDMRSVHRQYQSYLGEFYDLNFAYANTGLDNFFGQANLWCHGHTHETTEYNLDGTWVCCNPRGYHRDLGDGYTAVAEPNRDTSFDVNHRIPLENLI